MTTEDGTPGRTRFDQPHWETDRSFERGDPATGQHQKERTVKTVTAQQTV